MSAIQHIQVDLFSTEARRQEVRQEELRMQVPRNDARQQKKQRVADLCGEWLRQQREKKQHE